MKIELHAEKYVIQHDSLYFLCFVADHGAEWIPTPYMARHFSIIEDVDKALTELRKRSAARRRRKVKA